MFCPRCHAEYPESWKVCPTDANPLLKSPQIGKYAIDGVLGIGGMGAVYRAKNPDTGAAVAIKVMNADVATSQELRERFKREAGVVSRLDTVHVCKVYDFGNDADGTMFLVMELMKGHPLTSEIQPAPEYMDLARVQMVLDGALKGLTAAHKHGIVHRDLKPDNVFVAETFDGEIPKLLDFGIARVASAGEAHLTRTGTMMGTASYMAPEQVAGATSKIGPWSDVYAMGAIFYEMLAGAPAFGGETVTEVFHRVIRGDSVPLPALRAGLPDGIYQLIESCLHVDIAKRPQDAEAMRTALVAARLVAPGIAVPPPSKTHVEPAAAQVAPTVGDDGLPNRRPSADATAVLGKSSPTPSAPVAPAAAAVRTEQLARPASSKLRWIAVVAIVVVGGGAAFLWSRRGTKDGAKTAPPGDARVAMVAADAALADAAVAPVVASSTEHPDMVAIPAGVYAIGETTSTVAAPLPATQVTLAGFWIDKLEVTREHLEAALGDEVSATTRTQTAADPPTAPARWVDFDQAADACQAMGKRLPTEAEWEVAALTTPRDPKRARLRKQGSEADLVAPATDCSAQGLCDMLGSVIEWTSDDWPKQPKPSKVARGAAYKTPPGNVALATIHAREPLELQHAFLDVGFRCVIGPTLDAPDAPK